MNLKQTHQIRPDILFLSGLRFKNQHETYLQDSIAGASEFLHLEKMFFSYYISMAG